MGRILVVEDDRSLRFVVAELLRDEAMDVVEVENATDALVYLRTKDHIDLVFSDINMPGRLSGIDLAHTVQSDFPKIKIVLTSGRRWSPEDLDGLPFIPKPWKVTDLIRTIRAAL